MTYEIDEIVPFIPRFQKRADMRKTRKKSFFIGVMNLNGFNLIHEHSKSNRLSLWLLFISYKYVGLF